MIFSLGAGYKTKDITYTLYIDRESGAALSSDSKIYAYEVFDDGLLPEVVITSGQYYVFSSTAATER